MAAPTAEEIRQLSEQAQAFVPEAADRRPSTFLSLAPKTSDSYPATQKAKSAEVPLPLTAVALDEVTKESAGTTEAPKRRTSSLSSDGAKSAAGFRFLKLGPVHWGEHQGDHKTDFHDVVVD